MAAARRGGVSLKDICEEFGVSHRTAQRMTDALEETFGNVEAADGEDRKRRWRLVDPGLAQLQLRHETGVEALDIAARTAESEGRLRHAKALNDLRDGLLSRVPARARVEADAEAVLMAMGKSPGRGRRSTFNRISLTPSLSPCAAPSACGYATIRMQLLAFLNRTGFCWATGLTLLPAIRPRRTRYAIFAST